MARSNDGSNNFSTTGTSLTTFGCLSAMSIGFWFYPFAAPQTLSPMGACDATAANESFTCFQVGTTFWCRFTLTGTGLVTLTGGTVTANAWHQMTCVFDGGHCYLYGDGSIIQTSAATTGTIINIANELKVFARGQNGFWWNGRISDIGLWNTALTAAEAAALAKGFRPRQIRRASLVGYWPLAGIGAYPEPDFSGFARNIVRDTGIVDPVYATDPPLSLFTSKPPSLAVAGPSAAQIYMVDQAAAHFTRRIQPIAY